MGIDVDPPRKGMHHRECIDRDVGYGYHEEDVMLWRGLGGRLGVDLGDLLLRLAVWFLAGFLECQTGIDVDPPRKGMHHRECIDRDVGNGCHEEEMMRWRGLGGRLGVGLGNFCGCWWCGS